jgi:P-aminobenzoate N-oxygenase AurF
MPQTTTTRVEKLNAASLARVIEPDVDLPGRLGGGKVLPDDLLWPTAGIDPGVLDAGQAVAFSRYALAAITQAGLELEGVLMAGFGLQIVRTDDYTDPRITYLLHELGEETRHSRLFARLLDQLPTPAPNPMGNRVFETVARGVVDQVIHRPSLLYTMVLAGEEIPDLMQKRAADHPDTDPFVREVNRYHRQEEARHLAFARMMLPEVWERSSLADRTMVRFAAPTFIREMYENMIHAGVFGAVGLPAMPTWRAARNHPGRVAMRVEATRPVLRALVEAGALERGHVPRAWRALCQVDPDGEPVPA